MIDFANHLKLKMRDNENSKTRMDDTYNASLRRLKKLVYCHEKRNAVEAKKGDKILDIFQNGLDVAEFEINN